MGEICRMLAAGAATVVCWALAWAADNTADKSVLAVEQSRRLGRGVNVLGYDPTWQDRSKRRFPARYFRRIKGLDSAMCGSIGAPFAMAGYLWSDGRPTYSHLSQAITIV